MKFSGEGSTRINERQHLAGQGKCTFILDVHGTKEVGTRWQSLTFDFPE